MKKFISLLLIAGFFISMSVAASTKNTKAFEAGMSLAAIAGVGITNPRQLFQSLKTEFGDGRIITPAELRAEAPLINGTSDYLFSFYKTIGEGVLERKLKFQDAFRAFKLGIFLMAEPGAVPGIATLQTYPNPVVFPDEAGALQTSHLEHVYNGHLSLKVGDTTYIDDLPVSDCRVVNTAQKSAGTANSEKHSNDGYMELIGHIHLKGNENQDLRLTVPAHAAQRVQSAAAGAGAYIVKVVCVLRGFKITGAGK